MMKRKVRYIAFLLALIMSVSLFNACSGGQAGSVDASAAGSEQATGGNATDVKELLFWEWPWGPGADYGAATQKLVDEYNAANPGVKVTLKMMAWDGAYEQLITALNSGSAPDISTFNIAAVAQLNYMGHLLDLTDVVESWSDEVRNDFQEGVLELGSHNGSTFCIPYAADPRGIYYRKDIIEDELGFTGLDTKSADTVSWDTILEICAAIKERYGDEVYPLTFFVTNAGSHQAMMNVLYSNGASWIGEDGWSGGLSGDPKVLETMEFFQTCIDEGYFPEGMVSYGMSDVEKLYDSGRVAMVWKGSYGHVKENPELMENTALMAVPMGPSADKGRSASFSAAMFATKQTKYPEEAKHFIDWYMSNCLPVFREGNGAPVPVRNSFLEDDFYKNDPIQGPYADNAWANVESVWPASQVSPAAGQISGENIFGAPLEALLMGSTDIEGELEKCDAAMNAVFEQYRDYQ